ncbi:MAG: response regulator transcription factor [Tetrasphaera sp.]
MSDNATDHEFPIRIALVDDQALVRAGFRMVLDAQEDMVVVGEAGDGQEALHLLARTSADVVLMDIRMPRMDGVAATETICATMGSGPRVVVLTTFDLDEYAFAALRAGAAGFLLKDAGPAELLSAIRAVHRGDSVIAPSTTRRLLEHVAGQLPDASASASAPARERLGPLTPREIEVLTAVGQGLTNAEISASLFMAEGTVKTHIGRILHKLDLRDRVHMVMLAYETGLVEIRPQS